jgi:SPP1 gp7 family putative phage head morphogenesis protein
MPLNLLKEDDFKPKKFGAAKEALAERAAVTEDEFDALTAAARAQAFKIATVNNGRVVQQIRDLLAKAVEQGKTFAQIRDELLKVFDTKGLPRPVLYRLRFSFEEATRRAYAEAREAVLNSAEMMGTFGYRRYNSLDDSRVRPEHAALDGKVFAANDAFWARFSPPWDYGCRCFVTALTEGQVKRGRMTVWSYKGGRVVPVKGRGRPMRLARNRKYSRKPKFDLSGLDADLRKALEETIKDEGLTMDGQGIEWLQRHVVELQENDAEDGGVWIQLVPWGEVDSENGRFLFDAQSARSVLDIFAKRAVDLVVDYEHGSLHVKDGQPVPAAGWIKKLEARAKDGLYGLVWWTDRAREHIRAREYRYLSPATWNNEKTRRVVRLDSAGLVHKPAIKGGLPVAASRGTSKETNAMADEPGAGVDPTRYLARIAEVLGLDDSGDDAALFEGILQKVRALVKGGGEEKGEEGGEAEASSRKAWGVVANALGLPEESGEATIRTEIKTVKSVAAKVEAQAKQIGDLETQLNNQAFDQFIAPYEEAGVVNRDDEQDFKDVRAAHSEDPERCKRQLDKMMGVLPKPGMTTAPKGQATAASSKEDELIANALKEHDGDYGQAVEALQKNILTPLRDQGLTNSAAVAQARERYPKIFA